MNGFGESKTPAHTGGKGPSVFGPRLRLGKIFGFEIAIDASWVFVAVLVTWSLAAGWFPSRHEDLGQGTYWIMGVVGALGLFVSVVLHELSHSLVARRFGVEMKGITLFLFGGVAHMGSEPPTPRAEFWVAIAGPIASVLIAAVCFALTRGSEGLNAAAAITGVLGYLAVINAVLAGFNLIPAFPLDGGRVLRAILWHTKNNLKWATRITSRVGSGFGVLLIAMGIFAFVGGNFVGGMWWFLIGFFLRGVARASYQQLLVRRALEGEPIHRFMRSHPRTVPADAPLTSLVEDYFYRDYHKMYPVMEGDRPTGSITIKQVKEIPRTEWDRRRVGELAEPCGENNCVEAELDAVDALSLMQRTGISRLMVLDGGRLAGVVTLKDLLQFLAVKVELDEV